jgi:hypothetical protein
LTYKKDLRSYTKITTEPLQNIHIITIINHIMV